MNKANYFFKHYLSANNIHALMTFDPLPVNILYEAQVNYYVKNILVEIGRIV